MKDQTNRKNIIPYFENKGKTNQVKVNDIELFQDYFRILGLNTDMPFKTKAIEKARDKAISDYDNEVDKINFINKAFKILSDNTEYEFELSSKEIVKLTPRAFYLKQKRSYYDSSSTDKMLNALEKKSLTLLELQEYLVGGAQVSKYLASLINYAQGLENKDLLFFIIDNILNRKDIAKSKDLANALNNLLFNNSLRADLLKFLKNGANPKAVNNEGKTLADLVFTKSNIPDLKALIDYGSDPEMKDESTGETLLMWAVSKDADDLIKSLLKKGANLKVTSKKGKTAVDLARDGNKLKALKALVDNSSDPEMKDESTGETLLMWAVSKDADDLIKSLLKKGANLKVTSKKGKTAVDLARDGNKLKALKALVDNSSDPEMKDESTGETLLMWAVSRDADDLIKSLLKKGANLKVTSKKGKTAVDLARDGNKLKALKALVDNSSDPEMKDESTGETLLMWAVSRDAYDLIKSLAKKGANLKATNKKGKTAIDFAKDNNKLEALKAIAENGSDPEMKDKSTGETLLMWAVSRDAYDLIKSLAKKGANLKAINKEGKTAAHFARGEEKHETLKVLIENGSDPEMADVNGNTLLMYAAKRGLNSLIESLLKKEANLKAINKEGKTAAHFARGEEKHETLKVLIENGSDPEMADVNGNTLLMYAAKRGLNSLIESLLKKEANLKAINKEGKTAAHFARGEEKHETLKVLIENGSDPEMADVNGNTLLMYAAKRGLDSLIKVLIKKGANIDAINKEGKTALWFSQTHQKENEAEKVLIASGANTKDVDKTTKYMLDFYNDKIKFILHYHQSVKSAKDAIFNLEKLTFNKDESASLKIVKDCLENLQYNYDGTDLYDICGKLNNDYSNYH